MKRKKSKDLSDLGGMVFSTDPEFILDNEEKEDEIIAAEDQRLNVFTDKKHRKGKTVTVVSGYEGPASVLVDLARNLKTLCGAGGSVKEGEIIIQGEFKQRISDHLGKLGYNVKISS